MERTLTSSKANSIIYQNILGFHYIEKHVDYQVCENIGKES